MKKNKVGCIWTWREEKERKKSNRTFLTQMVPRCPTFSSFISCYSLCILVFQSDAVHKLHEITQNFFTAVVWYFRGSWVVIWQEMWNSGSGRGGRSPKNGSASKENNAIRKKRWRITEWFWQKTILQWKSWDWLLLFMYCYYFGTTAYHWQTRRPVKQRSQKPTVLQALSRCNSVSDVWCCCLLLCWLVSLLDCCFRVGGATLAWLWSTWPVFQLQLEKNWLFSPRPSFNFSAPYFCLVGFGHLISIVYALHNTFTSMTHSHLCWHTDNRLKHVITLVWFDLTSVN